MPIKMVPWGTRFDIMDNVSVLHVEAATEKEVSKCLFFSQLQYVLSEFVRKLCVFVETYFTELIAQSFLLRRD